MQIGAKGSIAVLLVLFFAIILLPQASYSAEITIKPGKFDHFVVEMPDSVVAGKETEIRLRAVDSFNNLITNFGDRVREYQIQVSGSAAVSPASFKSTAFSSGLFAFKLLDKTSESVIITIRESSSPLPIITKELNVYSDKLHSLQIKTPRTAVAGEVFDLRIIGRDQYGNIVEETVAGKNLNFIFKGEAEPRIEMPAMPDLAGGIADVRLVSEKAGSVVIEVKDLITGSTGQSERITVTSGSAAAFKVFAPREVISGETFEVLVVALDRFSNVVTGYSSAGSGVKITTTGKLSPFPSSIPAYEFTNGQAKIDLRYDAAEEIALVITENSRKITSSSDLINVISPIPSKYEVITPETAVAGQKFKIKILAYNQLGHIIKNYNLVGPDVDLVTTGTGAITPNRIPASEFINGTAVVEVNYTRSESFSIIASSARYEKPAATVKKKQPAAKQPQPAADMKSKQTKKPAKPAEEKKAVSERADSIKAKSAPFEITSVSIVEPKTRSNISVNIGNMSSAIKYAVSTKTADGKKWILLKIKNSVNKAGDSVRFDSAYVGEVTIAEDSKDKSAVLVKIELLKPSAFRVIKEKGALTVSLKR
ncbi:MAG: hypothetical protein RBT37_08115 [Dissulfurispiraceae bacterium]|jgi:hypothetical protein|nr:hypothetical protein [Dissulfurispiraceae bacterium]